MISFVIGPEGAGKAVFAAMLGDYIGRSADVGLEYLDVDAETKQYLADALALLRNGEWPATKGEKLASLQWKWRTGDQVSEVRLVDPPGPDMHHELCGESNALRIVETIQRADLLVLLVDLHGHQDASRDKRLENAWLIEHVLMNLTDRQHVIFAVTKADMLTAALPRDKWCDRDSILGLVGSTMPEFNLAGYRSRLSSDNCAVLAFSSVATAEKQTPDGVQARVPKCPPVSEGMDTVVKAVTRAWKDRAKRDKDALDAAADAKRQDDQRRLRAQQHARLRKIAASCLIFLAVAGAVAAIYVWRPASCPVCGGSGETTASRACPECEGKVIKKVGYRTCGNCSGDGVAAVSRLCGNCGGDGVINDDDWIPFDSVPCPTCDKGRISDEEPCKTCNGGGKVAEQLSCSQCTSGKIAEQVACLACNGTGNAPK